MIAMGGRALRGDTRLAGERNAAVECAPASPQRGMIVRGRQQLSCLCSALAALGVVPCHGLAVSR
jgi:hypothetical protein